MSETPLTAALPEDEPRGVRRPVLLAGGLAAALVLGAGGYLVLSGPSPSPELAGLPAVAGTVPVRTAASPSPSSSALPVPFHEALGRDPFRPLYVQPVAAVGTSVGASDPTVTGAAPAAAPVPAATSAAPVAPAVGVGVGSTGVAGPVAPAVPAATASPAAPTTPTTQEYPLVLQRVTGTGSALRAVFTVGGKTTTVAPAGTFGPTREIRLMSLREGPGSDQWTAVLQVGDGDPFDVVSGRTVSVR